MVNLTFEDCLIAKASSFPVFDIQFLCTWQLFLISLHRDLLTVRQVNPRVVSARFRGQTFPMIWNVLVNRLSELFHVQVQHIKVSLALRKGRFIILLLN